jgi:UvrB/uvrC motif
VYLRRRGEDVVVSRKPSEWGPLRSRRRAELAARALRGSAEAELAGLLRGAPLPRLRRKLADLAESRRFEDAGRLRDRIAALERVVRELAALERLRQARLCLLVPATEPGFMRAFLVAGGRVAAVRTLPPGPGSELELAAGLTAVERAEPSVAADDVDELLLIGEFLRRPPPELRIVAIERLSPKRSAGLGPGSQTEARRTQRFLSVGTASGAYGRTGPRGGSLRPR